MKYLIIEMQTDAEGNVATITTQKDTLNEAFSVYYMILAAAALSTLPHHAAVILRSDGFSMAFQDFAHESEA